MSLLGSGDGGGREPRALRRLEQVAAAEPPRVALRTLEEVVAERRVKPRDCRTCKNYEPDESGLGFGWCTAHRQSVKLFHPAGEWFSQCTFKGLRRFKPQELDRIAGAKLAAAAAEDRAAPAAEGAHR